jgi:hypothetical protein
MRNQHIARMCRPGNLNALKQSTRPDTADIPSILGFQPIQLGASKLCAFLTLALLTAGLASCAGQPPSAQKTTAPDVAIGVDAEFGVETFALSNPTITVATPANLDAFTIATNAGATSVDFTFTTTNYTGNEVHCYKDGVIFGTFTLNAAPASTTVTFTGLAKGGHNLACVLLDATGQDLVDATGAAQGVRQVRVIAPCTNDAQCDDGDACTGELCQLGQCKVQFTINCCASKFDCSVGSTCLNPNTAISQCSACTTDADCNDTKSCTTDVCDLSGSKGVCTNVKTDSNCCEDPADPCSDGKPCTNDSCDVANKTCLHNQPLGACCADSECVSDDVCKVGGCIAFQCRYGIDGFKPDCCDATTNSLCDDKDYCTIDTCSVGKPGGWTQCAHTADPGKPNCCDPAKDTCDDGQPCTLDQCLNNQCVHTIDKACCKQDVDCDDKNLCTIDSCNVAQQHCNHAQVENCCNLNSECADGLYCTTDYCDVPINTCKHNLLFATCCDEDTGCNDNKLCTSDVCVNHQCLGLPIAGCCDANNAYAICNDSQFCTIDSCDLTKNTCVHVNNGDTTCCDSAATCNDGDCSTLDTCSSSNTCINKADPYACKNDQDCDDGKPCTADKCDVGANGCGGCIYTLIDKCCTTDDYCIAADKAVNPYKAACHIDTCDLSTHFCKTEDKADCCLSDADALTKCNDNNACTVDYCQNNQCRHSTPPTGCCVGDVGVAGAGGCDDGVACSVDKCNIQAGQTSGTCQYTLPPNCLVCLAGSAPTDNNKCTTDTCVAGAAVHTPITGCCLDKTDCDDGLPCTGDSCIGNVCVHSDTVSGVPLCCNPAQENVQCASFNSDCTIGKCLAQTDGSLQCQATKKAACTVNLSYCQDFSQSSDLSTLGWDPTNISGTAATNWGTATTGNLGPDKHANFNWTPTKVGFDTCLQSPVFLGSGTSNITIQYDREFIPNIGQTGIRILGSLDGTYADWTTATVIDSFTATNGIGPETVDLKLPSSLVGSNGLRLAFCVNGSSTFNLSSYAIDNVCVVKGSAPIISACPANQVVPTGSKVSLPIKVKDADAADVLTASITGAPSFVSLSSLTYYFVDKSWNGVIVIAPTTQNDVGEYALGLKVSDGYLYHTCNFKVTVTYQGGVLIWKPTEVPTVMSNPVKAALTKQGQFSQMVTDLALYPSLNKFSSVFVLLGNYPDNHVLAESETTSLKLYLAQGGKVYMEGGDTFMYDPKTTLHPFFKAKGVLDDAPNGVTGPLTGYSAFADNTLTPPKHLGVAFNQDSTYDNLNDQIASDTSIQRTRDLLLNTGIEKFTVMVGHDDTTSKYRTIASSIPFAGVLAAADTPDTLMKEILIFFANGFGTCIKNADCDDGNGCTADTCTAGECTNSNTCLCGGNSSLGCGENAAKIPTNGGDSTNAVTTYTCDPTHTYLGHEYAFSYKGTSSKPVTVQISNVSNPSARLFVIKATSKGCDPEGCIGIGDVVNGKGTLNSVTFAAGKDQQYFFVVDVAEETGAATFDISVTCGNGEDCGNAADDNGNNLTDCQDTDSCCGDPLCAKEKCDGVDNNCNGQVDEGCDDDSDGYCDSSYTVIGSPAVCFAGVGDCNDTDSTINPGMPEVCGNGKDDNCILGQDEEGASGCVAFYRDVDVDTFGAGAAKCYCQATGQYKATKNGDCNDANVDVNPGVPETCLTTFDDNCDGNANDQGAVSCKNFYTDIDADGYGTSPFTCQCLPSGLLTADKPGDCQDANSNVNPGSVEKCNNLDDNCNGQTDEGCDDDGDKYCDSDMTYDASAVPVLVCPAGPGDTDDTDPSINPQGQEICDGKDNNSNAQIDEGCDDDGDDYCDANIYTIGTPPACPHGGNDCDDTAPTINPGMQENCGTPYDDNCNGSANDQNAVDCQPFFFDSDSDKWGSNSSKCLCAPLNQYKAINPGDCNESDPAINPGAAEICDGIDNNCDKVIDEGCDGDGDGYCHTGATIVGNPTICKNGINDCDDSNPNVNPGKAEICGNGKDDNCNGSQNDQDALGSVPFYQDLDGDTYGSTFSGKFCSPSGSYTATNSADCDDSKKSVNPAAVEICDNIDNNCDGTADEGCDDDNDGQCDANMTYSGPVAKCPNGSGDCNDNDASIFKGKSQEICDNKDDNCNGKTDDGCDDDHDGYCDAAFTVATPLPSICPKGSGDCDDLNSDQNPGAKEVCGNGLDDNCNGSQNDQDAAGCLTFYFDADSDAWGLSGSTGKCLCNSAGSYKATKIGDCDETSAAINPSASEVCDGKDNNCDGTVDENNATGCVVRYYDGDQDGYGISLNACTCASNAPYTASQAGDCNDTDANMNPGKTEKCDNIDNDCNAKVDEGCNKDGDQFCDKNMVVVGTPNVCVLGGGDCDDTDPNTSPAGNEVCDGKDNNCSAGGGPVQDVAIVGTGNSNALSNFIVQSFLAAHTGPLSSVDAYVKTTAAQNCDMYVYTGGLPGAGGTQVGSKVTISLPNTGGAFAKVTFTASSGVNLVSSATYYIVLNVPVVVGSPTIEDSPTSGAGSNPYASGQSWFASTLTGAYTALGSGNTDLHMTTFISAGTGIDEGCDDDADTYCDANMTTVGTPAACSHGGGDCNDTDPSINPGAPEVCGNTIDENCSGGYNDLNASGCTQFFADYDGDTYGKGSSSFQKAVINEIHYSSATFSGSSGADSVEILVTADWTATDLATIYFGDSQSGGTGKVGAFHLNLAALGITSLKAGTIVVVGGKGIIATEDKTYNPAGGDWNLQLWSDGAYVLTDAPTGDFGTADIAWVDTSFSGTTSIDSWAWAGAKSGTMGLVSKAQINTAPSTAVPYIQFTGDISGLDVATNYTTGASGTPGLPNGGKNTSFVTFLRTLSISGTGQCLCTGVAPYTATKGGDCDDGNYLASPGLAELCDGVDNNCNGVADEGCDDDGDGYCDATFTTIGSPSVCPSGGGDCNDTNSAIHPGATDICGNATDFNCDGIAGSTGGTGCVNYYWDGDNDGVGVNVFQCVCAATGNYKSLLNTDCDDTNANVSPLKTEDCSTAFDDNCNGTTNDVNATNCIAYYKDVDLDGYGSNSAANQCQCAPQGQFVAPAAGDCDDIKSAINPGATEICDNIDNNCNLVGGGSVNTVDVNQATTNASHAPTNFVAQTWIATKTGNLYSVDVYIGTASTLTLTMNVYAGGVPGTSATMPTGGTILGVQQSVSVPANGSVATKTTFVISGAAMPITAGNTYTLVFNTATSGQKIFDTSANPYSGGVAGFASTLAGSYGTYTSGTTDLEFSTTVAVPNPGVAIDEGCDDDADLFCDKTMYITSTATCTKSSKPPVGSSKLGDDCNDNSAAANPLGTEICDGIDNNCDAATDDGCDADKDGYCATSKTIAAGGFGAGTACFNQATTGAGNDCNDQNSAIYPGKSELCDTFDNDCNGVTDDNCDKDGDKYCDATMTTVGFPSACVNGGGDCNDTIATGANINPGKAELCDGIDNNCVGGTDEGCNDNDGDGYCNGAQAAGGKCPNGGGDCNDANAAIHPGGPEDCSTAFDDNCNGLTNEVNASNCNYWFVDADQDGYGSYPTVPVCQCAQSAPGSSPNYSATTGGDCLDSNAAVNPGATEICDGLDNNCQGPSSADVTVVGAQTLAGTLYVGQTFKAVAAGNLVTLSLTYTANTASSSSDLYIYTTLTGGGGPGTLLGKSSATVPVGASTVTYAIGNQVAMTAGGTYAFVVKVPATASLQISTANPYANGTAFTASALAGPYTAVALNDVAFTSKVSTGTGVDEGCDADGDLHCAVGKLITSTALCTGNKPFPTAGNTATGDDCLDTDATVYVGAVEVCDNVDNNCLLGADENCDVDNDDYCSNSAIMKNGVAVSTCISSGVGTGAVGNDCNDGSALIHPGAAIVEDCNTVGIDENCNGTDNELNANHCTFYYNDSDGDGWGVAANKQCWCRATATYTSLIINDCDDTNPAIKGGGVVETCDGKDNNCNGVTDEGCDKDGDGYCDKTMTVVASRGTTCPSTVIQGTLGDDCDDTTKNIKPGLTEMCDGLDNNCNASTDENCDKDGDRYCDKNLVTVGTPAACNLGGGDCNDTVGAVGTSINPGKVELCGDSLDNNCNGATDEQNASGCVNYYFDGDQDGYPVNSFQCMCSNNLQNLLFTVAQTGALLGGGTPIAGVSLDCNDNPAAGGADAYPTHAEWCDGLDNNCVSGVDELCDKDGDTYCDAAKVTKGTPAVCVKGGGDCNDSAGVGTSINPGAVEICDNVDQNCNGTIDDNAAAWCTAAGGPLVNAANNSTVACLSGVCNVTACATGYANINGTALPCNAAQTGCADGCECNVNDAYEPANNTCPGVQVIPSLGNTLRDIGNLNNGGGNTGQKTTITGSLILGTDQDWYYVYAQDADDFGINLQYELYTVRAWFPSNPTGAVMEVYRGASTAQLCPGSSTPNLVQYQNGAGKPTWNTWTPSGYSTPGTSTPAGGYNMVCCGDTDFWWYTSGNNYRQNYSNYYNEWGEWPCWSGDTYDTWDLQSTPAAAGSYTGWWIPQGWFAGATPGGANGGAHGPFPYGYDAHRCADDSAWYAFHVYRAAGTNAGICAPYTLEISNGTYPAQWYGHNEQGRSGW